MKKWFKILVSALFIACLCFALAGCGGLFGGGSGSGSGSAGSGSSSGSAGGSGSSSSGGSSQPQVDSDGTFIYSGSSIKAANTSISGDIVIPAERNGSPIDNIPANAFQGCTGITSITVPKEITSIGEGAFNGCSLLRSITLPFVGSQKGSTGKYAHFGYIFGKSSYQGSTTVRQYYSSDSSYNYYIPSTLRSVTITNESILGYCAFINCFMLTKIDLNDEILQIGESCFQWCSNVEEISLPSITILPSYTFSGCITLSKFTINDSVDTIGSNAFAGCGALSMINSDTAGTFIIPNSVTSIGEGAFNGCSLLRSITLPFVGSQKGNTGKAACFGYIFGESSYQGGTSVTQHGSSGGIWYYYQIPSALRNVTITNETVINDCAFENCSMLETITINSGANNNIGTNAFQGTVQPTWN